jgi:hypothetical protein
MAQIDDLCKWAIRSQEASALAYALLFNDYKFVRMEAPKAFIRKI